jgi:hypothetical protein
MKNAVSTGVTSKMTSSPTARSHPMMSGVEPGSITR